MVNEAVTLTDRVEHGRVLAGPRRHDGHAPLEAERSNVEIGYLVECAESKGCTMYDDIRGREIELLHQKRCDPRVGRLPDLKPDSVTEPTTPQLGLDGERQVVCVVAIDLDVRVPGDTKQRVANHSHPRPEQAVKVRGNDRLDGNESTRTRQRDEPLQHIGNLDPGEHQTANAAGAGQQHTDVQRQVGDRRKGMCAVDGQRCQNRMKNRVVEDPGLRTLHRREVAPVDERHATDCKRRDKRVKYGGVKTFGKERRPTSQHVEQFGPSESVCASSAHACIDAVAKRSNSDLEEFIEIRCSDRNETNPLKQRKRFDFGQREHAVVEVQPGELAIDRCGHQIQLRLGRRVGRVVGSNSDG